MAIRSRGLYGSCLKYLNQGILIESAAGENVFIEENMPKGGLFEDEKQIIKTSNWINYNNNKEDFLYNNNNKISREIFL